MTRPSGTVTLLFSDVESSTSLWERAPAEMARAVERHEELIRNSVAAHDGFVFKTVGDEFCVAFSVGAEAAKAALEAQVALSSEQWPPETPIRVRMALHSGACQERDDDYFGPTVNRAARLMAVANGGQVLASGATAALLGDTGGISLTGLGLHRLRDLGRPEQVFQLTNASLQADFPPLRSLDNPDLPNNLPALLSPFLGREHELEEVRALLRESRLVTLTGAGGAGKTRLAVQTAAELLDGSGDGVWFVELAPVTEEAKVAPTIAAAYGTQDSVETDPLDSLLRALAAQRALLVIDNCEHLIDQVAKVVDAIIRSCPGVHVLATSREPLGVDGERVYRVPSMSLPAEDIEDLEEAMSSDAIALFVGRAQDAGARIADSEAPLVISVCRRLDGIPLAMELAAARLTSMSLSQLSDRLDRRFQLLTGGARNAMARQQTLQALVDWSYGLLTHSEQVLLQRLSVFSGGFELDAAEMVCAGGDVDELDVLNLLHSLVEKSLVVADQDAGNVRYRLLETIHQYAATELLRAAGDAGVLELRDRHAQYFVALAERAADLLRGPEQAPWLARLDLELDNLNACLAHLASQPDERARDALSIVVNLERFFISRGVVDAVLIAKALIDRLPDDELVARACVTTGLGVGMLLTSQQQEVASSAPTAERAIEIAHELGLLDVEARAVGYRSMVAQYQNDVAKAGELMVRALDLATQSGDDHVYAQVLSWSLNGRVVAALDYSLEERRARALEIRAIANRQHDRLFIALACAQLATIETEGGATEESVAPYKEAIAIGEELGGEQAIFSARNNLTLVLLELHEFEEAKAQLRRCIRFARLTGYRQHPGDLIFAGAVIASHEGDMVRGARLHGAADELRREAYEVGQFSKTDAEIELEETSHSRTRDALGPDEFAREYERGRSLTAPEACDLVLGRPLD